MILFKARWARDEPDVTDRTFIVEAETTDEAVALLEEIGFTGTLYIEHYKNVATDSYLIG